MDVFNLTNAKEILDIEKSEQKLNPLVSEENINIYT